MFLVLHAIMSYFTYYVFYVLLFWALVSGRLTLCVPWLLSLHLIHSFMWYPVVTLIYLPVDCMYTVTACISNLVVLGICVSSCCFTVFILFMCYTNSINLLTNVNTDYPTSAKRIFFTQTRKKVHYNHIDSINLSIFRLYRYLSYSIVLQA